MTPAEKRKAVDHLEEAHGMSERRARRRIGCDRMTARSRSRRPNDRWSRGFVADQFACGRRLRSVNGKLRDAFLIETPFTSLGQARLALKDWRRDFTHVRPHSAIGGRTPAECAAEFAARRAKALALSDGSAPWPAALAAAGDCNRQIPVATA